MSNHKILVVDDEEAITFVLKSTLENAYDVKTTNRAVDAFDYLSENTVDLVLLDIKMPGIDGIQALKEIKKNHPDTTVIMLTAHASQENKEKALKLGAHKIISKPFDIIKMRKLVERTIKEHKN